MILPTPPTCKRSNKKDKSLIFQKIERPLRKQRKIKLLGPPVDRIPNLKSRIMNMGMIFQERKKCKNLLSKDTRALATMFLFWVLIQRQIGIEIENLKISHQINRKQRRFTGEISQRGRV